MSDWKALAEKELKGRSIQDIEWDTLEGIRIKPLYTDADTSDLDHPDIPKKLLKRQPFFVNDFRYEQIQRIQRWRFMSDQPDYDLGEKYMRKIEHRPQDLQ